MDFGVVDNLLLSPSATAHSNNGGSITSQSDADVSKLRLYGSASHTTTSAEDDLPPAKAARMPSGGGETAKAPPQGCHDGGALNQQMLGFSSANNAQNAAFAFVRDSSGLNGVNMNGLRGPFTPSQWIELEHQAMIYKYITANLPIPSHLLIPITKAIQSSGFPLSLLRPNGWSGFHLGLSKTDPEPGRCRRTDGKKWRCSREAVVDQKYCERHMNRGRNRSRKHVEGGATAKTTPSTSTSVVAAGGAAKSLGLLHHHQPERKHTPPKTNINRCIVDGYPEFGSVCSDSLLNPLDRKPEHAVRQFIDEWPKNFTGEKLAPSPASLSREYVATQIGVGVGNVMQLQQSQRQSNWVPIAWENSGGPLGEALHTATNFKNTKSLIGMMPPSLPAL